MKTTSNLLPKFIIGDRKTNLFSRLEDACMECGAEIIKRQKGYSDFDICQKLVTYGYAERRQSGPRGGVRYHATQLGRDVVAYFSVQLAA